MNKKRGRCRPKREPMQPAELKEQARINRERSAARRNELYLIEAEDTIAQMMDAKELRKIRESDIKELKRQAQVLWEKLEVEIWEQKQTISHPDDSHLTDEEFLDQPTVGGQMTRRQWLEEHKSTKPQRKNARKPKSITDIKPHKFDQYGLTAELEPGQDLDALERKLEHKLMEQAIKDKAEERKFSPPLGKRLREAQVLSTRSASQNFWV